MKRQGILLLPALIACLAASNCDSGGTVTGSVSPGPEENSGDDGGLGINLPPGLPGNCQKYAVCDCPDGQKGARCTETKIFLAGRNGIRPDIPSEDQPCICPSPKPDAAPSLQPDAFVPPAVMADAAPMPDTGTIEEDAEIATTPDAATEPDAPLPEPDASPQPDLAPKPDLAVAVDTYIPPVKTGIDASAPQTDVYVPPTTTVIPPTTPQPGKEPAPEPTPEPGIDGGVDLGTEVVDSGADFGPDRIDNGADLGPDHPTQCTTQTPTWADQISLSGEIEGSLISINWSVAGCSSKGFKVVWSTNPGPTYPGRSGMSDDYHWLENLYATTDHIGVDDYDPGTVIYVRVCQYLGGRCGTYSNEAAFTVPPRN